MLSSDEAQLQCGPYISLITWIISKAHGELQRGYFSTILTRVNRFQASELRAGGPRRRAKQVETNWARDWEQGAGLSGAKEMKGEDFPAVKFEVRTGYTSCMSMPLTEGIIGFSIKSRCQVLHNMSDNLIRVHGSKMYKPHVFSIPPHRHRCNLGYHSHLLSPRTLHVS